MANYCPNCGKSMNPEDSYCPKCGCRVNNDSDSYCGYSGNNGYTAPGSGYSGTRYSNNNELIDIIRVLTAIWSVLAILIGIIQTFVSIGFNINMAGFDNHAFLFGFAGIFTIMSGVFSIIAYSHLKTHTNKKLTAIMLFISGIAGANILTVIIGLLFAFLVYDSRNYFID